MDSEIETSLHLDKIHAFEKEITDRTRRSRSFFIFRIVLFLVVIVLLCVAPFFPFFSCRHLEVSGTFHLENETLLSYGGYRSSTPLLFVDEKKLEDSLNESPLIEEANVTWSLFALEIYADEIAAVLYTEDDTGIATYHLSNGSNLTQFYREHPDVEHDFHEEDTPRMISEQFTAFAVSRKERFLSHLKDIAPSILATADYLDITHIAGQPFFGFYFSTSSANDLYYRIAMQDSAFGYFLEANRLEIQLDVLDRIDDKEIFSDQSFLEHGTMKTLNYVNTVCIYDGDENACHLVTAETIEEGGNA